MEMQVGLNALFDQFNRQYFDGALPKYRVVLRRVKDINSAGRCNFKRQVIRITRGSGFDYREVLLHEMVHVMIGPGHGFAFHRKIETFMMKGTPVFPRLFVRPCWLQKLPHCRRWARQNNLPKLGGRDAKGRRLSDMRLEIEDAVIVGGVRDFKSIIGLLGKNPYGVPAEEMFDQTHSRQEKRIASRTFEAVMEIWPHSCS